MAELGIQIEQRDDAVVVKLTGEASLGNVDVMEREFMKVNALQPQKVVLDLSGLAFIASLGMGTLVSLEKNVKARRGGKVCAAGLNAEVHKAFTRARLDQIIDLYDSVGDALAA